MFITLTDNDDVNIRFNTDDISNYRSVSTDLNGNLITILKCTGEDKYHYLKETPEQIDTLLRESYISVKVPHV